MVNELVISDAIRDAIFREAMRCHPHEACGLILGRAGMKREATEFVACRNIQDELHAADPQRYPRTAATAYVIDPKQQVQIEKRVKESGLSILSVFHSHPEHDVYFSAEDKTNAAPWGEPLFPELSYFVVSVYAGAIRAASDFVWDSGPQDFIEVKYYMN